MAGGIGGVGSLGREDFGVDTGGGARERLERLVDEATAAGTRGPAGHRRGCPLDLPS